ncbi:MAG TPA: preprotein translocase subunit YajC [Nitrospiraceae bacterium]|nr:preprotein translocase subunit YajC [Nitrospiraceae bacterium]
MFIETAYAMGAPGGAGAQGGGGGAGLVMMAAIFAIFYFLLIRPQQKKMKDHKLMVEKLKKGDRIVTAGGMYGTVEGVSPQTLTVKISEGTKVKLTRSSVAAVVTTEEEKE